MKALKIKKQLSHLLAPAHFRCVNCGADVFDGGAFCTQCQKEVTLNNGKTCRRCGVALHGEENYCGNCAFEKTYFDRAYSPFCYKGAVQSALLKMKFGGLSVNAEIFARYLVYLAHAHELQFDLVTYVPMTPVSQKQRGYNQAELLAKHFCDILDMDDKLATLLVKKKQTERQETLGKKQRKENLVGAFVATEKLSGKTILLIDDIKTTGATLNECSKALKKRGAAKVVCLTVASREENLQMDLQEEL